MDCKMHRRDYQNCVKMETYGSGIGLTEKRMGENGKENICGSLTIYTVFMSAIPLLLSTITPLTAYQIYCLLLTFPTFTKVSVP